MVVAIIVVAVAVAIAMVAIVVVAIAVAIVIASTITITPIDMRSRCIVRMTSGSDNSTITFSQQTRAWQGRQYS